MNFLLITLSFILINLLCELFTIILLLLFLIVNTSIFKGYEYAIRNLANYSLKHILFLALYLMVGSTFISIIFAYIIFASFTNNAILWTILICIFNILDLSTKLYFLYQHLKKQLKIK